MQTPFFRRAGGVVALMALCGLTACVTQAQQQSYPLPYQAQGYQNQGDALHGIERGRVVHIEALPSQGRGQTSGAGAVIGAVVGGVLGNQVGRGGGRVAATAVGAVGGAVVGNVVEERNQSGQHPSQPQGYRITIQLDQGGRRAYDVRTPGDVRVGDHVRMHNGQISRY
jgi:outer membrane lipoprotein SlyB